MESIVDSQDRLHFFEYLQVDLLQEYLRTGISYFVNAVLNSSPSLVPFRYWSQEITALIDFLKDFISLSTKKATYAQNFFGYERKSMGKWSALKGAIVWAILPYLSGRLQGFYNQIVGEALDGRRLSLIKKIVKEVYPYMYAIFGLLQAFFKFRYLYVDAENDKNYYHIFYLLEKLHLGRAPTQPQQKYPILELMKKPGLLLILIGHKIMTWYFSQKKEKKAGAGQGVKEVMAPLNVDQVKESGKCSICTKRVKNATMVRHTGYVYCWECIGNYVRKERRCPLGGVQASPQSLQILYG